MSDLIELVMVRKYQRIAI